MRLKPAQMTWIAAALLTFPFAAVRAEDAAADLSAYDAGYAAKAAQSCPNLKLAVAIDAEKQASADFKRGAAMFDRFAETLKIDGACRSALNLYDAKIGKVAKVLQPK